MSAYEDEARRAFGPDAALCGLDEAGRGPLAGPVCAGACVVDKDKPVFGVDDSKKLSPKKRGELLPLIKENARAWATVLIDAATIDRINILEATKLAMKTAVFALSHTAEEASCYAASLCEGAVAAVERGGSRLVPDELLLDALTLPGMDLPQVPIVKGDAKSVSIASASILAKQTRDALCEEYEKLYPGYGFSAHKGYGTAAHIQAIKTLGPLPIHRRSFIKNFIQK